MFLDMKRFALFIGIILLVCGFSSCAKEEIPADNFSIIGKWAMVSGSIAQPDGIIERYSELGDNQYYQYLEFRVDGTYNRIFLPSRDSSLGVYVYNDANKTLKHKLNSQQYYVNATVNVLSPKEMIISSDYGSGGRVTKYLIKVRDE